MKGSLLKPFVICIFLTSCSYLPRNPESWMERKINACLPTAIAFKQGLNRQDVWAEVLIYHFNHTKTKKQSGHAIVVYMYPSGKNQLWTYDLWGSYRTRAFKTDALDIAKKAVSARNEDKDVTFAYFLR